MLTIYHHRVIEAVQKHIILARKVVDDPWFPDCMREEFAECTDKCQTALDAFLDDDEGWEHLCEMHDDLDACKKRVMLASK